MSTILKEGPLQMWDGRSERWQPAYARLQQSGWFYWYEKSTSKRPLHGVDLKVVAAYFAFGDMIHQLPGQPVDVTAENRSRIIAVPHEAHRATTITFFMCNNDTEMSSWITTISSMLDEQIPENNQTTPSGGNPNYFDGSLEHVPPTFMTPLMAPPLTNTATTASTYPAQPEQILATPVALPGQRTAHPHPSPVNYPEPMQSGHYFYPQPISPVHASQVYSSPPIIQPVAYMVPTYQPQPVYTTPSNYNSGMHYPVHSVPVQQIQVVPQTTVPRDHGWRTAAIGFASGLAGNVVANRLFGGGWGGVWGGGWGGGYGGGWGGRWGGGWGGVHDHGPVIIEETNIYNTEINDYDHGTDVGYTDDFDNGSFSGGFDDS
ncbi:hypothetical protein FGIG_05990 [Fasciola gigantica]|uniref:PH domain-containing protein n=1 Tax=Fasciola gigantica TaxID=46835 RepID=A0A504YYK7_FASGI|nr:hypothetical protein FGIG_05990 [Fasciola gigantica]